MIIVTVQLLSAVTGSATELARMTIINDGAGTKGLGNYNVTTLRGRSTYELDLMRPQREGRVDDYPRLRVHVWNLVARALRSMGYEQ